MAEQDKKPGGTKKVIDIVDASEREVSQTQPVISGHGPIMQDQSSKTSAEEDDEVSEEKAEARPMVHELTIEPKTEKKPDEPADQTEQPAKDEPSETAPEPPKEPSANEKTDDGDEANEEKVPEKSDEQKQKELQAEADAKAAHAAHIAELVNSQKFFLPINRKEKMKNKHALLIGAVICVILAVVWLDVTLDAGLITNSYNLPHTHFFSVKP